jgi:hypothetical protein
VAKLTELSRTSAPFLTISDEIWLNSSDRRGLCHTFPIVCTVQTVADRAAAICTVQSHHHALPDCEKDWDLETAPALSLE